MEEFQSITVFCHAGYRGEEYPKMFTWKNQTVEVKNIEKRWLEPGFRFFRVINGEGTVFLLRCREQNLGWEGCALKKKWLFSGPLSLLLLFSVTPIFQGFYHNGGLVTVKLPELPDAGHPFKPTLFRFNFHSTDIGESPVLVRIIEAITDDPGVGDVETQVVNLNRFF